MTGYSNVFRLVPSAGAKRRPKFFTSIQLNGMANRNALIRCVQIILMLIVQEGFVFAGNFLGVRILSSM